MLTNPAPRDGWSRLTKGLVFASALGALLFESLQAGREHAWLPACVIATMALVHLIARRYPERTAGIVMALGYLAPTLLLLTIGYRFYNVSLWFGALLGVLAARNRPTWQYPARFGFPLIAWALAIACSWPLVALRIVDWDPSILWRLPATPSLIVHRMPLMTWVSDMALAQLLGLLWIDWLFGQFGAPASNPDGDVARVARFERAIIHPLLLMAALAACLGVYQGVVDLRFLSIGSWADIGRATGALVDGNASGALNALWTPIALGVAVRARSSRTAAVLALVGVALLVATWTTGSRTSLLCALVGVAAFAHLAIKGSVDRRNLWLTAAIALVVFSVAALSLTSSARGPLRRVAEVLPGLSREQIRDAARQLWERQGYGTAAVAMIADEPWQGVGVGAFHMMVPEYSLAQSGVPIPSDNAQNWIRHQLAELGVLGSVGSLLWAVLLIATLFATPLRAQFQVPSLVVKYAIAGFGLASLLGMPGQNPLVALTVWTFAFWLIAMIGRDGRWPESDSRERRHVIAALALAVVFAAVTAYAGWHDLRPPFVARHLNYPYEEGFYESVQGRAGQAQTSQHGVSVPSAPGAAMKLTVWVEHPDADARPVEVDVWIDRERIIHGRFPRNARLTRVVTVPGGNQRFVLETRVDRTFRSTGEQPREVGLNLEWEFRESSREPSN